MSVLLSRAEIVRPLQNGYFAFPKTSANNFHLALSGKSPLCPCAILSHQEGRLAIATNAGQGAADAGSRKACEKLADGEAVWS
jgi:hypothetical protein